jgi:hypothetical protein
MGGMASTMIREEAPASQSRESNFSSLKPVRFWPEPTDGNMVKSLG